MNVLKVEMVDIDQNSPEWDEARRGVITASCFSNIVQRTGKPSTQRKKYLYKLAAEVVSGYKVASYSNAIMERGHEVEQEARQAYSDATLNEIDHVGFCFMDESHRVGASPDGLVGEDGGVEIKCPDAHTHVEYLLSNKLPVKYLQQVQGSMYVTGRSWWNFVSYYPGLKPLILKVERDDKFIGLLDAEITKSIDEMDKVIKAIR